MIIQKTLQTALDYLENMTSYNLSSYLKSENLENMTEKLNSNFNKINESLESGDLMVFKDVVQDELLVTLEELKPVFKEELTGLEGKES